MDYWRPEIPPIGATLWLAPALVVWVAAVAAAAARLKRTGWRTGDTRKLVHALIFTTAAGLAVTIGVAGVNLLGLCMAAAVGLAVWRGRGDLFFEALAREHPTEATGFEPPLDRPRAFLTRRRLLVILPYLCTAAGGILSFWLFGRWAVVGLIVAGWGDAAGEAVGMRFGRRRYRVPTLDGVRQERSVEGSAAVFAASLIGTLAVLWLTPVGGGMTLGGILLTSLTVSAVATLVEAISPHGIDNLTMQVAASATARMLTGEV